MRLLHTLRVMGFADAPRLAERLGIAVDEVDEHLLDAHARGWVSRSGFSGLDGWSITESGKEHAETLVAAELVMVGVRAEVESEYYDRFLPLNAEVTAACTAWQLTELGIGEPTTLDRIISSLRGPAEALRGLESRLGALLPRLTGYHLRFAAALGRASTDPAWINGIERDSCHRVWFELHEDLIATLGLRR